MKSRKKCTMYDVRCCTKVTTRIQDEPEKSFRIDDIATHFRRDEELLVRYSRLD